MIWAIRSGADVTPKHREQASLGTPPGGILLRDPSAAKQDDVTIMFYQQQISCRTAFGREQMALPSC
jgi:hypothetical protein